MGKHVTINQLRLAAQRSKNGINALEKRISELEFRQSDYYVEGYDPGTTDVTPVVSYGSKSLLKRFDFYLLDTTDNNGTTTHPVGKLQPNNLLRFADAGAWAPVVGITAEQAADAERELYCIAQGAYTKYCDDGAYSAEDYVANVLRPWYAGTLSDMDSPQLYKSDGDGGFIEAHALCPWETTETKYTIGIAHDHKIYVLDNIVGNSGYVWKGIFIGKTEWDGIDLTPYALERTAIAPCPVCTVKDGGVSKTRNFFYLYDGDTNCQGATGIDGVFDMFAQGGRTYPRTSDVSQISNMNLARANNADSNSPLPFAEGGYFTLDAFTIAQELLYSRRNPFKADMFGSGISSNDSCNNVSAWRTNGGVRYKKSDVESPSFATFASTAPMYYMSGSELKKTNWNDILNKSAQKELCMESQIVASFVKEFGITATTDVTAPCFFSVYGGRYYYMNIDSIDGIEEGYMNVRIYREIEKTGVAFLDENGNDVKYDIAVVLRMSLMGGANLSGDVFAYWGGGCEVVGTCGENTENGTYGHTMDGYLQPDQSKWARETAYTKDDLGRFEFEDVYNHMLTYENKSNGYTIQRCANMPVRLIAGGNISQGECYYNYDQKYWSNKKDQRVRVGLRFRGYAFSGFCSPRFWIATYSAAATARSYGGSAQARIE